MSVAFIKLFADPVGVNLRPASFPHTSDAGWERGDALLHSHCISARVGAVEGVMRAVRFLATASVFSSIFIGVALMSAITAGVVHSAIAARQLTPN
jgi:hypothetical protein